MSSNLGTLEQFLNIYEQLASFVSGLPAHPNHIEGMRYISTGCLWVKEGILNSNFNEVAANEPEPTVVDKAAEETKQLEADLDQERFI